MSRFFYIKKQQRNVEDHYWLNSKLSEPYPLTQAKIISEVVGLAFYQLMGVRTPKTYVSQADCGPVIMSQEMDQWKPCKAEPSFFNQQLEPLPASIIGLPELELASAFLGDIDVVGWLYDNIGLQQEVIENQNVLIITKHDAGTAIVETEQYEHFKQYFNDTLDKFPEGTMTLSENPELKHTYLKVFNTPSITKYSQHYNHVFSNVSPQMRVDALRKLFNISPDDIRSMVNKISKELYLPETKQEEIVRFMQNRLVLFKKQYSHLVYEAADENKSVADKLVLKRLVDQKHILRDKHYLTERFEIQPRDEKNPDYSQSSARYFKKLPKQDGGVSNSQEETRTYFL